MRLIDADAAVIKLGAMMDEGLSIDSFYGALEALDRMPTIDPVKHGRWGKLDLWTKPVCSVCGKPCFGLHGFSYETTAYCPNCGARMEGEVVCLWPG